MGKQVAEVVDLSLIEPATPEQRRYAEAAYRRGFFQGAYAAVEAMDEGRTPSELDNWVDRLLKWRFKGDCMKRIEPEWLGRKGGK